MAGGKRIDLRVAIRQFVAAGDNMNLLNEIDYNLRQSGLDWPTLAIMMAESKSTGSIWEDVFTGAVSTGVVLPEDEYMSAAIMGMNEFIRRFDEWRSQQKSSEAGSDETPPADREDDREQ